MNDYAKLQAIRPVVLDSFKALIRDELIRANVIKTVDKSFGGDYNGSVDKFTHISTDYNEKWVLENDGIARICFRVCLNKGNLSHYKVIACCRILLDTSMKYFALVEYANNKEWLEVNDVSSRLFDEIDSDKHGTNVSWAYNWEKYDANKLTNWLLHFALPCTLNQ